MDGFKTCLHVSSGQFRPTTSVEHKSIAPDGELATVTFLCPVCSAAMVRVLQQLEEDPGRVWIGKKSD